MTLDQNLEKKEFAKWISWDGLHIGYSKCHGSLVCLMNGKKFRVVGFQGSWWEVMGQEVG